MSRNILPYVRRMTSMFQNRSNKNNSIYWAIVQSLWISGNQFCWQEHCPGKEEGSFIVSYIFGRNPLYSRTTRPRPMNTDTFCFVLWSSSGYGSWTLVFTHKSCTKRGLDPRVIYKQPDKHIKTYTVSLIFLHRRWQGTFPLLPPRFVYREYGV